MELLLSNPYAFLDVFLLIFVRIISLFIAVPIFSNRNIPNMVKIGLSIFISAILVNILEVELTITSANFIGYFSAVLKEIFIGWCIGFGAYIAGTVVMLAGQFIDQQIGFAMVNVFDPLSQVQLSITGTFYYYLVLLIMLVTHRHHLFLNAIVKSYDYIPIGQLNIISGSLYVDFLNFYKELFILSLRIAAPFFLAMLVSNVILAILARTAPQLNLFVIGFPIKLLMGLFVLYITMNVFDTVGVMVYEKMEQFMGELIRGLSSR